MTGFQQPSTINRQEQNLILSKLITEKRYKSICEKTAIIVSDTSSSNSNKNEECGGEKEELNFDFTIDESCSADKNIQCDLYKNEIEKLQKELIAYKDELIERNEEIYKLREKIIYLKPVNFHISI